MRITIDPDRCVGAGQCVLVAPTIFAQREDDGIVVLLDPDPPEAERERAREAADLCPAQAIIILDDEG